MLINIKIGTRLFVVGVLFALLLGSCSNKKNTTISRAYHSVNTRYNIHFNAQIAYNDELEGKYAETNDNLSQILHIYPDNSDTTNQQHTGGFVTTIDKTTKAIKMHSIKTKPKRDRLKMQDPKYRAWLQQQEFNPFLYNTWILLAKAEFEGGNYLRAITTFMYISKIYSSNTEIVSECRLMIARAYTEMGWMYEAENVLRKMEQAGGAPSSLLGLYSSVKANYLVHNGQYKDAVPHLVNAIAKEKQGLQKIRMRYLLGQLYAKMGDRENAYQAFKSVKGISTPYKYSFNADLHLVELSDLNMEQTTKRFEKMVSNSKNKDYLDLIYYTVGNKYMQISDTANAIKHYKKGIKQSVRKDYDLAMVQLSLGDIYFERRDFISAQPCYSNAVTILKKNHEAYSRVYIRSSVLDELVVHVKVVHYQDSLQHLAQLPEQERMEIINKKIEVLKEEEKEEIAQAKARETQSLQGQGGSWESVLSSTSMKETPSTVPTQQLWQQGTPSSFYFYNTQTVDQGRIAFQNKWGRRKLEDDWRRKNKTVSLFGDIISEDTENGDASLAEKAEKDDVDKTQNVSEDKYSPEYYLQQLPLTEEAVAASDVLIEDALYNMGKIYRYKLENMTLAIDAFVTDIKRFPNSPNMEDIYYQLFLIYMQLKDGDNMSMYRNKLITEFPKGEYAIPLSQPDYEWNFRHMAPLQDSLYMATYDAYLLSDVNTVRNNYELIQTKYPFGDLMPKFSLLNALSYAQTKDINELGDNLKSLIAKYPKSEVVPLATDILERIINGQILLSDGTPIHSLDWSKAFVPKEIVTEDGKSIEYKDRSETDYILLLTFAAKSVDKNELLYQVADYNFSNYVIQVHDLSFQSDAFTETLQIKGFKNLSALKNYMNRAWAEGGLFNQLHLNMSILPISVENYVVLPKLGLDAYKQFFAEHYGHQMPAMVNYWNIHTTGMPEASTGMPKVKEPVKVEEDKLIETELTGGKIVIGEDDIAIDNKPVKKDDEDKQELNLEDVLSDDQLEAIGGVSESIETIGEIWSNPVDGAKSLFDKFKSNKKLTKEEKQEIKELERLEKQKEKELKAEIRAKADSIQKVEKTLQDSIQKTNDERIARELSEQQDRKDKATAELKAKKDAQKLKEEERKQHIRQQQQTRKQRERELNEQRKAKERERNEKLKARDVERKMKLKETEQRRKEQQKMRDKS